RLSIPKSTLDYWVKKLRAGKPIESLRKHKPVDNEKMELTRLKRELAEVKMERDILKKAVAYFAKESLMKYAFIKNMRLIYPLPVMCRVLSVSKSGYYAWLIRPPTYEGWLYCATHKDLYNGEIVGYALDSRLTKELVIKSLYPIHHSDRGIQYCSYEYGNLSRHIKE
ncbi:MAG TPA: hypothetical protein PLM71_10550, partial [Syntrophorhabdaceae bacterium]|nr:hypothetical protein [Syntrophorhabdaceae bacterium]